MAGKKETPRQKMIAMMYLVLTALLALNVSKQMLDAFIVVNESMESTIETFAGKTEDAYREFNKQYKLNPNKVAPFWEKAEEVQMLSKELVNYIDSIKYALIIQTEPKITDEESAKNINLYDLQNKDKYTEPTRFFFGRSVDGSSGVSGQLRKKIDTYRARMLEFMNEDAKSDRLGLLTKGPYYNADGQKQTWEQHNFYYTILAADITILNKLAGEVKNAEFDAVNYLYSSVTAMDFKFDDITAKVISNNSYVLQGQPYEAEVLVAAYDTKQNPEVFVLQGVDELNSTNIKKAQPVTGKKGVAKLSFPTNQEGVKKYAGVIRVTNPTGGKTDYPFKSEYIVAPPSLTVAATKMNVFYIGVDNPVSISVPGIADEKIYPEILNGTGTLKRNTNGKGWIVRVNKGVTKTTITAKAEFQGKLVDLGKQEFRVKKVPDPMGEIAGLNTGSIEKNTLLAANAIIPKMKDFEFDLNFIVKSFNMGTIINGDWIPKSADGNTFSNEMQEIIRNAKRGQKFFFENIQAVGPDGTIRTLNTINLTIK